MMATRISLVLGIAILSLSPVVYCQTYNLRQVSYTVLESTSHVIVEITRTGSVSSATSVLVTTLPGTASSPGDYTLLNQRREFIVDSQSLIVRINIEDDDLQEGDEAFRIQISDQSVGSIGPNSTANITIQDDDAEFSFERATYASVPESDSAITIAVLRNGYLNKDVNVYISTLEGDPSDATRATPDVDFNRLVETRLQFLAGTDRIEVQVGIIPDQTPEPTELLDVQIVRVEGGQIAATNSITTLSISDDDVEYAINQASFSTRETPGQTQVTVTITRRVNIQSRSTILVYTEDDSATASSRDYIVYNNRVEFLAGASTATATITVLDDNEYEPVAEVFYVGIRSPEPSGFVLTSASRRPITIEDNESIFSILKPAYTVKEADESVVVEIRRTGDLSQQTSVRVRSIAVSATPGEDYANVDQELIFSPNQQGVNLEIAVANDDITGEDNEVFLVELYQASVSVLDPDRASTEITIEDSPRLSTLAIVLIAVGCAIFVILILIMLLCCCAFMRPSGPREPFLYDRGPRGPVVTHIPDELDDRRRERLDWPHRHSERRINGAVVQNGGPRITELNERDYEPHRESNRHASNDQPSPPPPPPAQERLPEGRNELEPPTDRRGETSDPRRTRSMFNSQGDREPFWGKARHSHHSSPNNYGYF